MNEEQRYAAVQADIKRLLDAAANDKSPGSIIGIGSVLLAAKMSGLNEQAHLHAKEARAGLVRTLQRRIERENSHE